MKTAMLLGLLLLIPLAAGLECAVDNDPYIRLTSNPSAFCLHDSPENNRCTTWLSDPDNNSDVWGMMPERETVQGVGEVDYYQSRGAAAVVEFSKDRLFDNQTVTFNVQCGSEWASYNVTPHFTQYEKVPEGWLWAKQNIEYLIMLAFIVFATVAAWLWIWRNKA